MTEGFYKTDTYKTSNDDTWTTPRAFFERYNNTFNFSLDAAALQSSTLVPDNWYGPDHPESARRDAFQQPRFSSDEYQTKAKEDFQAKWESICYEATAKGGSSV